MNNLNDRNMPNVEMNIKPVEEIEDEINKQIDEDFEEKKERKIPGKKVFLENDVFEAPKKQKKIPLMSDTDSNTGVDEDLIDTNKDDYIRKREELRKKRSERMKLLHAEGKLNKKKKKVDNNKGSTPLYNSPTASDEVLTKLNKLENQMLNLNKGSTPLYNSPTASGIAEKKYDYKLTKNQMLNYTNKIKSKAVLDYQERDKIKINQEELHRKKQIQEANRKYFSRLPKINMLENSNPFDNCF